MLFLLNLQILSLSGSFAALNSLIMKITLAKKSNFHLDNKILSWSESMWIKFDNEFNGKSDVGFSQYWIILVGSHMCL